MESILNSLRSLFSAYGFRAAVTVLLTVVVVNLIKKPIVKKAQSLMETCGYDKSAVTKNITWMPVAVAFVIDLITELALCRFDVFTVDYGAVASEAVLYGALAIATYESVKKQLEAYAAKKNAPAAIKPQIAEEKPDDEPTETAQMQENAEVGIIFDANGGDEN